MGARLDILGQTFGNLTVVEYMEGKVISGEYRKGSYWRCSCSCGGELIASAGQLRSSLKSCTMCRTNKNIKEFVGKVFNSKSCGKYEVIQYLNAKEITVRFLNTGFTTVSELKEVKDGKIKDLLLPSVSGIGYVGVGPYLCNVRIESGKTKNTPEYEVWNGMLKRCYNKEWRDKGRHYSYEGVTVCKEWHCFQTFANWYNDNKPDYDDFALDKDLKIIGNREYSPDACTFVPDRVNALFTGTTDKRELPRGVHLCTTKKLYIVQLHRGELTKNGNPKQSYLGAYTDKDLAISIYQKEKIKLVNEVAEEYKSVLHPDVYFNLKNKVLEFVGHVK